MTEIRDTASPVAPAVTSPGRRRFLISLGVLGGALSAGLLGWEKHRRDEALEGLRAAQRAGTAFGTSISMTVLHADAATAERALDAAFAELAAIDATLSLYQPAGELCALNRTGQVTAPSAHLRAVLAHAQQTAEQTHGAFDVTVQPYWEAYAAAQAHGRLPDTATLRSAARLVDWRALHVSRDRVTLAQSGMAVTLNGIAQGYAADRVVAVLREQGIAHALVNTGEIGALGRKGRDAWQVGVQHPRKPRAFAALAAVEDRFLSTSGDYAASFTPDHRAHHIFTPASGQSPAGFSSVTVAARTGMQADALSTAAFVLGVEAGQTLIADTPGADGFFMTKNGLQIATPGFPQVECPATAAACGAAGCNACRLAAHPRQKGWA